LAIQSSHFSGKNNGKSVESTINWPDQTIETCSKLHAVSQALAETSAAIASMLLRSCSGLFSSLARHLDKMKTFSTFGQT